MTSEERKEWAKKIHKLLEMYEKTPSGFGCLQAFDLTCELADLMEIINQQEEELKKIEEKFRDTHIDHGGMG